MYTSNKSVANLVKLTVAAACATCVLTANVALADTTAPAAKAHNHKVVSRQTEKSKTDTGFVRTTTKTDEAGATAQRVATVVNDKAAGTRTRSVTGTTFEGKSYSGESVAHKTDSGYTSEGQMTGPNGKKTSRDVSAVVDKQAGTVTKTISVTPEGGETTTTTKVVPLHKAGNN